MSRRSRQKVSRVVRETITQANDERLIEGELKRVGRPREKDKGIILKVAERLPQWVVDYLDPEDNGVYVLFDSRGWPCYVGRGNIKGRVSAHFKSHAKAPVIRTFSFYVVEGKAKERELETILIRLASPLLVVNDYKVGGKNPREFEAGTRFLEVKPRLGRKKSKHKSRRQKE